VVGLERVAVGVAERVGEFFGGVRDVVAEGLGGEVEATVVMLGDAMESARRKNTPVQPYKAFGGCVLLLLELVEDEVLEGF
jgi:hypothetical protein